ncbi:MAG: hypothetical protein HFE73_03360 [Firmicutes bacterium]|nr:hypothetical protein [Bacillota bacterium]
MREKRTKLLAAMLCVCLLFTIIPQMVYGAEPIKTGVIDLNSKKDFSGEGYSWDAASRTLTLDHANLIAEEDSPLIWLPDEGDVVIYLKGENTLQAREIYTAVIADGQTESRGKLTITGDGTGSLSLKGCMKLYSKGDTIISGCHVSIEPVGEAGAGSWAYSNQQSANLVIHENAKLQVTGRIQVGGNLIINGGKLENNKVGCIYVYGSMAVINRGVLHSQNETENLEQGVITVEGAFAADETSEVKVVNEAGAYGIYGAGGDVSLLSKNILVSGMQKAFHIEKEGKAPSVVVSKELNKFYQVVTEKTRGKWHYINLYKPCKDGKNRVAKVVSYVSKEAADKRVQEQTAVEETELKLAATIEDGKIRLQWTGSESVRPDYYEIYRVTKRNTDFSETPYHRSNFGLVMEYMDSSVKGDKTYYYRVRGVKVIDGKVCYTQWSNKIGKTVK